MSDTSKTVLEFGPFRLDTGTHSLTRGEESLPLPPKAFEILVLLVRNSGRVLSKKELMEELWPDSFVEEANLTQNIFLLRKALGEEQGEYIKTVPRVGYRFVAPVRELDETGALEGVSRTRKHVVVHEEVVEHEEETPEPRVAKIPPATQKPSTFRRVFPATLIGAAILLVAIVGAAIWLARERRSKAALETGAPIDSIAVLPFANQAGDADSEYLSDGITESLINSLTQLRGLRVVPRTTVFHYKGREADAQTIGRELKVRAVLVGRLLQRGDTLSIQTELIDVDNETQLWGEQYNRKVSDILSIQEDIGKEISEKLRLKLSGEEQQRLARRPTQNAEAYQLYLKGSYFTAKYSKAGLDKGMQYFNQAIAVDPNYALAYDGLAYNYVTAVGFYVSDREAMPKIRDAASKAVALDGTLGEPHNSLAVFHWWFERDWPAAEEEFKRGSDLNPNYPRIHWFYGWFLISVGRIEEGIRESKRAVEIDPLSPESNLGLGQNLFFAGRYDEAIEQLKTTLEMDENFWLARDFLGRAYEAKGKFAEAISEFQRARETEADVPENWSNLGHAYAMAGKTAEAQTILERLNRMPPSNYLSAYNMAALHAGIGNRNEAFAWLNRAYDEHSYCLASYLKTDPQMDSLRSDPRFADFVQRLKFPR